MTAADLLGHLRTLRMQPPASPAARGEAAQALFLASAHLPSCDHTAPCDACKLAGDLLDGRDLEPETVLRLEDMVRGPQKLRASSVVVHETAALWGGQDSAFAEALTRCRLANGPWPEEDPSDWDDGGRDRRCPICRDEMCACGNVYDCEHDTDQRHGWSPLTRLGPDDASEHIGHSLHQATVVGR